MFSGFSLGNLELVNRFVLPPIKLGYGNPDGTVTDRQLTFYQQIARNGPGILILEPVSVTADGREHPRQPCIHLSESATEFKKIVDVVHGEGRIACLHLNHAGTGDYNKSYEGPDLRGRPSGHKCGTIHDQMDKVTLMPHTTVKEFLVQSIDIEQDGVRMSLEPFQSVILASGMRSTAGPDDGLMNAVSMMEVIGDAREVQDIFSAVHAGYNLALKY